MSARISPVRGSMRHERHLRLRNRFAFFLPRGVATGQQLIHRPHADLHRFAGSALKIGIERRVNAIALGLQVGFGELLEEMVLHHVHEIGRGTAVDAAVHEFQFRFFRRLLPARREVAVLDHLLQARGRAPLRRGPCGVRRKSSGLARE